MLAVDGRVGFVGCACASNVPLAPVGSFRQEGNTLVLELDQLPELQAVGGAVRVPTAGLGPAVEQLIVARISAHEVRVLSSICTHRGRELQLRPDEQRLECCSGKSVFDLDGTVLEGPASTPLMVFPVRQQERQLVVDI